MRPVGNDPSGFDEALIRHEISNGSYLGANASMGGQFIQISEETPAVNSHGPVPLSEVALDRLADTDVHFFRVRRWGGKSGMLVSIHTPVPRADRAYDVRHIYNCAQQISRCGASYLSTMIRRKHGWEAVKTTVLVIE